MALVLAACSAPPKAVEPKTAPVEYFHVDMASAGQVEGRVTFHGNKATPKRLTTGSDPGCPQTVYEQALTAGKNGGLANVFVYIQSGLEGKRFEPADHPVIMDQHGCMFVPRVMGMRAGQTLDVKNSDRVSHNIHPMPANNREWNQQQSPESPDLEHKFPRPDVMIPVKCNVHSWMRAYIGVVDHPYFAVTGPDGRFEFKNVPPGDYTIAAWHETLGELKQPLHVAASARSALDFRYQ